MHSGSQSLTDRINFHNSACQKFVERMGDLFYDAADSF